MPTHRDLEIETLRRLSADDKLSLMTALWRQAVELKLAWVLETQPELSEAEALTRAREAVAGGRA